MESLNLVGVDLAGSPKRPTGLCIMNESKHVNVGIVLEDSNLVSGILQARPKLVAIDAPLALPRGRHCLAEHCRGKNHFRACDLELRKMGIRFFPITLGPMRMLTNRGIRIRRTLERAGLTVVETYPGAAQDLLGFPRRQHGMDRLQRALLAFGCSGDISARNLTGDELDAVTCALVAWLHCHGASMRIGDEKEIQMVLPKCDEDWNCRVK